MLGGTAEVSTKKFYIGSLEVKSHLGMPRDAKVSLALNEPK